MSQGLLLVLCLACRPAGAEPLITEFLAVNLGGLKDEDGDTPDWIELHNPVPTPINLTGWALTDSITNLTKWRLPATNLSPGGYLVVFASGKDRRVTGPPLHTNFKLDAEGEYLALVRPDGTNVVSAFAPAFRPQVANVSFGIGLAAPAVTVLTAHNPAHVLVPADGSLGTTWTAPSFDESAWLAGTNGVGYETSPADYADLIRTAVPEMFNNRSSCYVRLPFVIENPTGFSGWRLLIRYDDGFVAYLNGQEIVRRNAPAMPAWNSLASADHPDAVAVVPEPIDLGDISRLLVPGTNILALHGLNVRLDSSDLVLEATLEASPSALGEVKQVYFPIPTPGKENRGGVEALGPILREAAHAPAQPAAADALLVTVRADPAFSPVASVSLGYRVMYGAEADLPMFDDGAHGDGAENDGVFAATIPAGATGPGQMIRYRFEAVDARGAVSRLPLFFDPRDSPAYFGTVAADPSIQSALPVVHLFVQNPSASESFTGTRCALWFLGEFYDNVGISLHGQSSSGFPKKGYNLDFNGDQRFRYATNAARVKDLRLLTNYGDKSRTHNALAYEAIHDAGSVGHFCFQVRVQRNGQFHAILDLMEDGDDRWLERVGLSPDGALYKMYNALDSVGGNEKKTRKAEGNQDLQTLVNSLSGSQPLTTRVLYAYDQLDLPQIISYFAALALISSQDHGHKNYYLYRDTVGTGEWSIFPWDVDLCFGRNWTDSGGYFTDTMYTNNVLSFYNPAQQVKPANRLYHLIFDHPDFRRMYLRRLRTLMDTQLQPPGTPPDQLRLERRVREMMDLMDPPEIGTSDADLDYTKWGSWGNRNPMRVEAQRILDLYLPGRRNFLFNSAAATLNGERIPDAQPLNPAVLIDQIEFNPSSGNQQEEFIRLTNTEPYTVDVSGWTLRDAVEMTFRPGTVIPAGHTLYASPNVVAFRARRTGPGAGQGLFVQGNYRGQLSARGERLELRDGAGRLLVETNYSGNPTPAQLALRLTELMYHPPLPPAGSPYLDEDFEFIELKNVGPTTLDLNGIRFTEGVTFGFSGSAITTLSPGAHVLVVKNSAAFADRYGPGLPVAGEYEGRLENAGESLRLEDSTGEVVFEFSYSPLWQPRSDGGGASLEVAEPAGSLSQPSNWHASASVGGSPGEGAARPLVIRSFRIEGGALTLSFGATAGRGYSIQRRASLVVGSWEVAKRLPLAAEDREVQVQLELPPASPTQFYQLSSP